MVKSKGDNKADAAKVAAMKLDMDQLDKKVEGVHTKVEGIRLKVTEVKKQLTSVEELML